MTEQNLYDKYGGAATISKIVHNFYSKVTESDEIGHFFERINIEALMSHQVKMFSHIFGGPVEYEVERLKPAHITLEISEDDFSEMSELLEEALEEADIEEADIAQVLNAVNALKSHVIAE